MNDVLSSAVQSMACQSDEALPKVQVIVPAFTMLWAGQQYSQFICWIYPAPALSNQIYLNQSLIMQESCTQLPVIMTCYTPDLGTR